MRPHNPPPFSLKELGQTGFSKRMCYLSAGTIDSIAAFLATCYTTWESRGLLEVPQNLGGAVLRQIFTDDR
ncbi:hypothetical protein IFM89_009955 [Coptis chinensis]|uniref:Uncharacterized protein n=1 Tax=Coptis chinensis TaxID=261450 RepID=A0A835LV10_9MAGN|nr:hypothetical protein IFM89_009955 [Coptis chinensis]